MKNVYILAMIVVFIITIFLFGLLIYGFLKGLKEGAHNPDYYSGSLLPEPPENRIQHVDSFGTWVGYSVPSENGEMKHYDWMGTYQGSSRQ